MLLISLFSLISLTYQSTFFTNFEEMSKNNIALHLVVFSVFFLFGLITESVYGSKTALELDDLLNEKL